MASDDRGPELAAVTILFLALTTISTALRCYVRVRLLCIFKTEDFLAVFTYFCFVLYSATVLLSIEHGQGRHTDAVPPDEVPIVLKWRWTGEVTWVVNSVLLKYTIGIFLLRICTRKWQSWVIWGTLAVVTVYHGFYFFIVVFQCRPVPWYWERYSPEGKAGLIEPGECWSSNFTSKPTYVSATLNALADWILGLLPIALVWNLPLNIRMKISTGAVIGLGSLASAATIVRFPYIHELRASHDPLYVFVNLAIWSTVENGVGLTASALATLRPLFKKILGKDKTVTPPAYQNQDRRSRTIMGGNTNNVQLASGLFCRGSSRHANEPIDLESNSPERPCESSQYESSMEPTKGRTLSGATDMTWEPPKSPRDVGIAVTRDRYFDDTPEDSDTLGEWRPDGYLRSSHAGSSRYSR